MAIIFIKTMLLCTHGGFIADELLINIFKIISFNFIICIYCRYECKQKLFEILIIQECEDIRRPKCLQTVEKSMQVIFPFLSDVLFPTYITNIYEQTGSVTFWSKLSR